MPKVIKLRKGLDINLKGKPNRTILPAVKGTAVMLMPDAFVGMTPKVVVKEGDNVLAGSPLFVNKYYPEVRFASPVSGRVTAVKRGERRKVLGVLLEADSEQQYVDYGKKDLAAMDGEAVKMALLEAGLFGYINQLPYAISANPVTYPKAIFVSAFRDRPLSADFEFELQGNEKDFQTGLTALTKMAKTYLGISPKQTATALTQANEVVINVFDGPCPAANVGVQVNHIAPVNKGETVWTVDPSAVIFFGRLFNTGKVNLHRLIALAGSGVKEPGYVEVTVGQRIGDVIAGELIEGRHLRVISGDVLTGKPVTADDFLGAHSAEITVIPEGDDADELLGWIMPRLKMFSTNRSYCSWLQKNKQYDLDARIKGSKRHLIMSGEYDRVLPMNIYGEYLIKAIIAQDIDQMEALGIYEVAPEDFALAEFVDSSKLELQKIVREGLDLLRKENA